MFDSSAHMPFTLMNAQIVTLDGIVEGGLAVDGDKIAGLTNARDGIDLRGQFLIPGLVDIHTDHAERHVHPRLSVQWDFLPALMAHDAVVISGGTTTVFDSLSVGASIKHPERREILIPMIEALAEGQHKHMFRAQHVLHLRCEISDPATANLIDATIDHDLTKLVSVMDHTPGDRQNPDPEAWLNYMLRELEVGESKGRAMMADLLIRAREIGPKMRQHVIATAHSRGVPLMSHDDRDHNHITTALAEGIEISEFPTTIEAARAARAAGMIIVAGAPNYLRGGSQSGNVAVADLLAEGLVDIFASDYVPRSLLDAAFKLAAAPGQNMDLPQAVSLVSTTPARLTGLADRGYLAEGMRADLVAVRLERGQPVVSAVWRAGHRVF